MKPFLLLATRPEDAPAETEYRTYVELLGVQPEDLRWIRVNEGPLPELDLDDYSGVILAGSPYNATDPEGRKSADQRRAEADISGLLDRIVADDVPFLGCCYGVGTLGKHQGAVVDRQYGEPASAITVTLTDAGRNDPLVQASGLPDRFLALVGHKEAISLLPPNAVNLGSSTGAPVQFFRTRGRQYATQFHPELDVERFLERLAQYLDEGYIDPADYDDLAVEVRQHAVDQPERLLRGFRELFAR
ncbi:glutamine amidotransferase [Brachybacterium sp. EF45031]|uniref:glutamine amidotransferase n=1 Tax=Brachybacterium sillae TaxID=2810536 RepID=UPI00217EB2F7|nr:glutamine amidotransferase [Brachybacterium sillae]MCS6711775.1 glutamine amidotransferase [Brachybacterium sillae]